MHLNGDVVVISSLFLDEASNTLGNHFYLGDTWEANKLNEPVNVVVKTLDEGFRPGQPDKCNFCIGKTCPNRSDGWYSLYKIGELMVFLSRRSSVSSCSKGVISHFDSPRLLQHCFNFFNYLFRGDIKTCTLNRTLKKIARMA